MYETALKKKETINHKIGQINEGINVNVSECWVNHQIKESTKDMNIAAGDGSINKRKFVPFIFYAIDAEVILHTPEGNKRIISSDIDIISHHKYVEDRLRNYMGILEIRNGLKLFNEYPVDFFLFDGSILGNLIRPLPIEKELNDFVKSKLRNNFQRVLLSGIVNELNNNEEPKVLSSELFASIKDEFEDYTGAMIYLETLESLLSIAEFLRYNKKIVAVSKTSTSYEYFNEKIPDMAIFDMHSKKQGYSKPRYMHGTEIKREFPIGNFLQGLAFTVFYARLDDNKNILKFELPYHASEEDIQKLLSNIKQITAEGYPLLLKMAHDDVVIRRNDLENLSTIVGVDEKTGREMLNE